MISEYTHHRADVALSLSMRGIDCVLLLNGDDISRFVRGVEVRAMVGEPTAITFHLLGNVTIDGVAGRVRLRVDDAPPPREVE